jgi:hypothetical protein
MGESEIDERQWLKVMRHYRAIARHQKEKTDSGCFATTLSVFPFARRHLSRRACAARICGRQRGPAAQAVPRVVPPRRGGA